MRVGAGVLVTGFCAAGSWKSVLIGCLYVFGFGQSQITGRISNLFQDKGTFSVPPGSFALWLVGRNLRDDSGRLILRCCSAHGRLISGGDGNADSPFYFCLDGLLSF